MGKSKTSKSVLFLILIFGILTVTSIVLFFSLKTDPVEEALKNDQLLKVLMVLYDDNEVISTDVVFYYPVTHRAAMFDIPSRTGAIYNSLARVDSIDSVYIEKGIDTYKREIEKLLDISINFTLEVSLKDFAQLADLLGGLRVFIPSPVEETKDDTLYLLPSGSVTLDGDKVVTYLKYTSEDETESDIQDRRQNIILSFFTALNSNISKVFTDNTFKYYARLLKSDIDIDGLHRLLSELATIDAERLVPQTITGSIRKVDDKNLLFPFYDGQLIKDACKQSMSALTSVAQVAYSRTYVLEIQNGTSVQGLAKNTAALLQSVGYDVLTMTNADKNDYEKTVIIDHISNPEIASSLGEFIMCDNIVTEEVKEESEGLEADSLVDFTIILGKDFDGRYVR